MLPAVRLGQLGGWEKALFGSAKPIYISIDTHVRQQQQSKPTHGPRLALFRQAHISES